MNVYIYILCKYKYVIIYIYSMYIYIYSMYMYIYIHMTCSLYTCSNKLSYKYMRLYELHAYIRGSLDPGSN